MILARKQIAVKRIVFLSEKEQNDGISDRLYIR